MELSESDRKRLGQLIAKLVQGGPEGAVAAQKIADMSARLGLTGGELQEQFLRGDATSHERPPPRPPPSHAPAAAPPPKAASTPPRPIKTRVGPPVFGLNWRALGVGALRLLAIIVVWAVLRAMLFPRVEHAATLPDLALPPASTTIVQPEAAPERVQPTSPSRAPSDSATTQAEPTGAPDSGVITSDGVQSARSVPQEDIALQGATSRTPTTPQ